MNTSFTVACIQMTSGPDVAGNIAQACVWVRDAHNAGAELIVLPEGVNTLELDSQALAQKATLETDDSGLAAFCALAFELQIWLLVGSLSLRHETAIDETGNPMFANRSFMIGPDGIVQDRYRKIHLFDVDLGAGESYRESKSYQPGRDAVLTDTPWGKLGMTIGYDIRFPQLYRQLAQAGAAYLSVPAAFARPSGKAHWHVLMRARAIENGCYVFAAAQCGDHGGGRLTYGHSLIVDPWGNVLADGGQETGFILADIDPAEVDLARAKIPSLSQG